MSILWAVNTIAAVKGCDMLETLDRRHYYRGENVSDRDNQQGTPTEAEIAWLAGIIEGEGTLMLGAWARNEKSGTRNAKIHLNITIYNTDAYLMRQVVSLLDRLNLSFYTGERMMKPMKKEGGGEYRSINPMIQIKIGKLTHVQSLLTRLRPWLFGDKSARADIMMRYLENRFRKIEAAGNPRQVPYGRDDLEIASEFYRLTRTGKSPQVERLLNEHE